MTDPSEDGTDPDAGMTDTSAPGPLLQPSVPEATQPPQALVRLQ